MSNWKLAAAVAAVLLGTTAGAHSSAANQHPRAVAPSVGDTSRAVEALRREFGSRLVALAPVERVLETDGIQVLGNIVRGAPIDHVLTGDYVAVIGSPASAGTIAAEHVFVLSTGYVPGAFRIGLVAVVDAVDLSVARATVGQLTIDYSAALSAVGLERLQAGDAVYLEGIQPAPGGILLVDNWAATNLALLGRGSLGADRTDGSLGTGRTDGSLGTGRTDGSLGTGRTDGSLGTGRTDGSLGTGRTDGSLGTGRTDGSLGTGRTDGSLGTGRTDGSLGTGKTGSLGTGRTDGSLGTGRTDGSLGTGRTDGSLGTGKTGSLGTGRTDGSLGTGRTDGSLGTGRTDGSLGTGRGDSRR